MLLERLKAERENGKRPELPAAENIVLKNPFCLTYARPTRPCIPADKVFLMEIGMDEIDAEIILSLWEAGGRLAIWGKGKEPDLCHDLDLTSPNIRRHVSNLQTLGIVKTDYQNGIEFVTAATPQELKKTFDSVMKERLTHVNRFFDIRSAEFASLITKTDKKIDFIPDGYLIDDETNLSLMKLAERPKLTCGFIVGTVNFERKLLIIEDFSSIETRSGPKIHYVPRWASYHSTKNKLVSAGKKIIGEFHTHPNGDTRLTSQDKEKQAMLGRGVWFIVTPKNIECYLFAGGNEEILKRLT